MEVQSPNGWTAREVLGIPFLDAASDNWPPSPFRQIYIPQTRSPSLTPPQPTVIL